MSGIADEVLEQQHGEAQAPVPRVEIARLLHELERKRGRGERERKADEDRGLPRKAERQRDCRQHERQ